MISMSPLHSECLIRSKTTQFGANLRQTFQNNTCLTLQSARSTATVCVVLRCLYRYSKGRSIAYLTGDVLALVVTAVALSKSSGPAIQNGTDTFKKMDRHIDGVSPLKNPQNT